MPLILRHARKRPGTWGPDDYDVINGSGGVVGRIFRTRAAAPPDASWAWSITGAAVAPVVQGTGFATTKDEAKAALAQAWREWCARTGRDEDHRPLYG